MRITLHIKHKILTLSILCLTISQIQAQTSRTLQITAGKLDSIVFVIKAKNITKLTLSGTMDARDFKFIRDSMKQIQILDLYNTKILSYTGKDGTDYGYKDDSYKEDELPRYALYGYSYLYSNIRKLKLPKTLKSIGYRSLMGCCCLVKIDIPKTVTNIQPEAFKACSNLKTIKLPSGLTEISRSLFERCINLKSIKIPHNVKHIGFSAFNSCEALTKLDLPNTVTKISKSAFYCCFELKEINIPSQVSTINSRTFSYCTNLRSITLPDSLKEIHEEAFTHCSKLTINKLPNNIDSISNGALGECQFISVEENNPSYLIEDSVLFSKDKKRLLFCPASKKGSYIIPANVERIDICAFYGSKLNTLNIQAAIDSIDEKTFMSCQYLESINLPNSIKKN